MSYAEFKCLTAPRVIVGPKMADIGNTHMHGNFYFENKTSEEKIRTESHERTSC